MDSLQASNGQRAQEYPSVIAAPSNSTNYLRGTKTHWIKGQNSVQARIIYAVNDAFAKLRLPPPRRGYTYNLTNEVDRNRALLEHLNNAYEGLGKLSALDLSEISVQELHPLMQSYLMSKTSMVKTIFLSQETVDNLAEEHRVQITDKVKVVKEVKEGEK